MIKPYTAVGLIPTVRGIRKRKDIMLNIEHLTHLVKAASWLSSLDLPVRLIAFPEGALQGFNDEVLDLDHAQFAREGAIDIPGEETEALGKIADFDAIINLQVPKETIVERLSARRSCRDSRWCGTSTCPARRGSCSTWTRCAGPSATWPPTPTRP